MERACVTSRVSVVGRSIAMHNERDNKHANEDAVPTGAVPAYLLDREGVSRAKVRPSLRARGSV